MAEGPMLVLGATGGQGGAVLAALLARGARVRALVRDPVAGAARRLADRGVEVVAGSLNDEGSLAAAMDGTAGLFALTTPFEAGVDAEVEQGRRLWPRRGGCGCGCPTCCSARWPGPTSTAGCRTSTAKR